MDEEEKVDEMYASAVLLNLNIGLNREICLALCAGLEVYLRE